MTHASAISQLGATIRLRPPLQNPVRRSPTAILALLGVLPDPATRQLGSLEQWEEVRTQRGRIGLSTLDAPVTGGSPARGYLSQLQQETGRSVPRNLKALGELVGSPLEILPAGDDVEVRRKDEDRATIVSGEVVDLQGRVLLDDIDRTGPILDGLVKELNLDMELWQGDLSQALGTYGLELAHAQQVRLRSRKLLDRYGLTELVDVHSDRVRSAEQAEDLFRTWFLSQFAQQMPDAATARRLLEHGDPKLRAAWQLMEKDPVFFGVKANIAGFFFNGGGQAHLALTGVAEPAAVRTVAKELEVFSTQRDITLLAAPGLHRSAQRDVLEYGSQHGFFSVLDAGPDPLKELRALPKAELRQRFDQHGQGAWYGPGLKMLNPADITLAGTPRTVVVPCVGFVAGAIGLTDAIFGVHEPPANVPVVGHRGVSTVYGNADYNRLFSEFKTNLIGPYLDHRVDLLAGETTTSTSVERSMVSVARVEGQIRRELRDFFMSRMFQRNSSVDRAHLVNAIGSHLEHYQDKGALRGFLVEDLTDRECEDQGVVNLQISLDIVGSVRAFVVDLLPGRHDPQYRA